MNIEILINIIKNLILIKHNHILNINIIRKYFNKNLNCISYY
jgi:hypothetical protein